MGLAPLSIVVPVYNEAVRLEPNLRRVLAFLDARGLDAEVVCVDDGSTDGSGDILHALARVEPRLRVLSLPRNHGKGAAVRGGVLAARGEAVIFMDADLSTGLEAIDAALAALRDGAQMVLGSRRVPGARIVGAQPRWRDTLGQGFSRLAALLVDRDVPDFTCGFKAFSASAAQTLFSRARLDGWAFDAELVARARRLGLRIAMVPVEWHDEPGSKVRFPGALLGSLVDLVRIARWKRNGHLG
jgi:glycosyltransferase involved in cell wall biosynthesis